jgi:hypothetical protein
MIDSIFDFKPFLIAKVGYENVFKGKIPAQIPKYNHSRV